LRFGVVAAQSISSQRAKARLLEYLLRVHSQKHKSCLNIKAGNKNIKCRLSGDIKKRTELFVSYLTLNNL